MRSGAGARHRPSRTGGNPPGRSRNRSPSPAPVPPTSARHRAVPRGSEEHTSELQSLMRISYAVFCLKKTKTDTSVAIVNVREQCTHANDDKQCTQRIAKEHSHHYSQA